MKKIKEGNMYHIVGITTAGLHVEFNGRYRGWVKSKNGQEEKLIHCFTNEKSGGMMNLRENKIELISRPNY